jgi:heat shock protein HtpX
MAWFKRIFLFGIVNLLILVTISIVLNLLGIQPYLSAYRINYPSLMIFCLLWGMGGAVISLALSRVMAKWMMGVQVIDPQTTNPGMQELVRLVYSLAERAQLPRMPEVGIYESESLNAFATGPTKARALVAVSTGLLNRMNRDEIEGVLGHEITHITNGDMVTMTLLQGIINAFVMFIARIVAFALSQSVRQDARRMVNFLVTLVLEIALSFLGFLVVAAFSRWREFRADRGGAQLAGTQKMIGALEALQTYVELQVPTKSQTVATLQISGKRGGLLSFMSTHPPLEERIRRLREYR